MRWSQPPAAAAQLQFVRRLARMTFDDAILAGSDEECWNALRNESESLVVDHRDEEQEVLGEIVRLLPGFSFAHHFDSEGTCHVQATFHDRTFNRQYINTPNNCFRIIRDVEALIQPDASIRAYAPTAGDDTHILVLRDRSFWERFTREASQPRKEMFINVEFLDAAWELSGPAKKPKKWWQVWQ
jgi:hypothetical protein